MISKVMVMMMTRSISELLNIHLCLLLSKVLLCKWKFFFGPDKHFLSHDKHFSERLHQSYLDLLTLLTSQKNLTQKYSFQQFLVQEILNKMLFNQKILTNQQCLIQKFLNSKVFELKSF